MKEFIQASFNIPDISTWQISAFGSIALSSPIYATNLAASLPGLFWMEKDSNGLDTLCMIKGIDNFSIFITDGVSTIKVFPQPFVRMDIFGPNPPTVTPGPRK